MLILHLLKNNTFVLSTYRSSVPRYLKTIIPMSMIQDSGGKPRLWEKLTGNPEELSIENRTFNYVCVITFFLLAASLLFDIFICQSLMIGVVSGLIVVLGILYYLSRFRKIYKIGITLFTTFSYFALAINYFANEGINGPTLILFFVTFFFLITLTKRRFHPLWIAVHISVVMALLAVEYYKPGLVPTTYPNRPSRFMDMGVTTIICMIFIYAINRYLNNFYHSRVVLADDRALAISDQNKKILAQNQMLERVNEEKNKLFSIVSHDLKAPLDSIRGYLILLSGNMLDEDEKQNIEDELLDQTKYTTDLLMNLMSWAKAQMHGVVVNLVPLHLKTLVEEVAGHKKSVAARKGIKLTYSIYPTIEVVGDKDMLHIVLRNLVNNAIKFTDAGGEVCIKATKMGEKVMISIQDTGIGIPIEKQAEIFTLKTQSTYGTNKEKGIGLGLMMCKEFMDYQQGDIWFESEPGKGTTFYIALPMTLL